MQNLGNKLSEVQTQVSGWVGNMRRSLQEAVELVSGALEREGAMEEDEERGRRFERAISPLRSFASRGRQSLRNLSLQSRQRFSLRRRTSTSNSNSGQMKDCVEEEEQETDSVTMETDSPEINDTVDGQKKISQALQRLISPVKRRNASTDSDTLTASVQDTEQLLFPESSAPLLDSSVFKAKADLGKKRSIKRSRPSRAVRQRAALPALTEATNPDWRFCDSTDAQAQSSNRQDSSEEEEEPSKETTPSPAPSQPKRVAVFPGMDQSALMAQLRRRSVIMEAEAASEGQTPPAVSARSPRTPTKSLGPRVLPPVNGRDSGSGSSPSWLLELKSKKRMSQPESDA